MKAFQIMKNEVLIINEDKQYIETKDNFKIDGGSLKVTLKKTTTVDGESKIEYIEVTPSTIIYDDNQGHCVVDGEWIDYPQETLDAVINEVDKYISSKIQREYVPPTFEELKAKKAGEIKSIYLEKLYAPAWFTQIMVNPDGSTYEKFVGYDTDQNSQIDFHSSKARAELQGHTLYNIYVNPDNLKEKKFTYHTKEMFARALLEAGEYQEGVYITYYGLCAELEKAKTQEDLEKIIW